MFPRSLYPFESLPTSRLTIPPAECYCLSTSSTKNALTHSSSRGERCFVHHSIPSSPHHTRNTLVRGLKTSRYLLLSSPPLSHLNPCCSSASSSTPHPPSMPSTLPLPPPLLPLFTPPLSPSESMALPPGPEDGESTAAAPSACLSALSRCIGQPFKKKTASRNML